MVTGIFLVTTDVLRRIVIFVVSHQENVRRVNQVFGEKTVRKPVESVSQISAVKLMDDAHHVHLDMLVITALYNVVFIIAARTHVV
jgi:hypothetical protein